MNDDELDLWLSVHNEQCDERINAETDVELRRQQVLSAAASAPRDDEPDADEAHAVWSEPRSRRGRVPSAGGRIRRATTRPASVRPRKRPSPHLSPGVPRLKRKSADVISSLAVIMAVLGLLVVSAVAVDFGSQWTAAPPSRDRDRSVVIGIASTERAGTLQGSLSYGFAAYLADWLADNMHYSPVTHYSFLDIGDNAGMLRRGEVDMIINTGPITGQDGTSFAGPYLLVQGGLLVRSGTAIHSIEDLAGKRVCTWDGSTYGEQSTGLGNSVPVEKDLLSACLDSLKDGSLDAIAGDQFLLWGIAEAQESEALSVVPGLNFGTRQRYGIELARDNVDGCDEIRDAIRRFITSGAWDQAFKATMPNVPKGMLKPDPDHLDRCE